MEERLQAGLRFFDGDARLEAAEGLRPTEAAVVEAAEPGVGARQIVVHRNGDADLRGEPRLDAVKAGLADADDGQWLAVHDDLLAQYIAVAAEARFPIAVTENGQRVAALDQVVGGVEDAADRGADAEHGKEVSRDGLAADQLGAARESGAHGFAVRAEHAAEHLVLIADVLVHRVGKFVAAVVAAVVVAASRQHHQLFRIADRKPLQK